MDELEWIALFLVGVAAYTYLYPLAIDFNEHVAEIGASFGGLERRG